MCVRMSVVAYVYIFGCVVCICVCVCVYRRRNVDTEEMHLEVCSGSSSVSFGREGEAAGLDDSGIKLLQGILTELSSLK